MDLDISYANHHPVRNQKLIQCNAITRDKGLEYRLFSPNPQHGDGRNAKTYTVILRAGHKNLKNRGVE